MKILNHFEQGSLEWAQQRCGLITMSNAKALLTGGRGKTRESYLLDVVAEQLSGEPLEGYYSIDMERGNFLEEWAVRAFEKATELTVDSVGFVLHDDERIGCSPDGLIGENEGIEIKCPKPRQHIRNIFNDGISDYRDQAQGCMWITDRAAWYIVSYCPWVKQYPLYIKRINRDQNVIDKLAKSAIEGADWVDDLVNKAKQDRVLTERIASIAAQSRDAWENVLADNSEVQL